MLRIHLHPLRKSFSKRNVLLQEYGLPRRFAPRNDSGTDCVSICGHSETSAHTGRGNPFPFAGSFCMGKVLPQEYGLPRRFAPRNDSERETHCGFAGGAIVVVTVPCADRRGRRSLHRTIVTRIVGTFSPGRSVR